MLYGAAEGANSILTMPVGLVLLYFLTQVVGIRPAVAGTLIGLGMITDAFTDPLIGILSDRSNSKWGRRRPFMLAGAWVAILVDPLGTVVG
jgi:Na+/melibiose symporter-like transporter